MNKLIIILAIIFSMTMAMEVKSRQGEITLKHSVNLRAEPNPRSTIVGSIEKGKVLKYTDVLGYAFLNVVKGDSRKTTSDHVGKKGYMWTVCVGEEQVINHGCTLRKTPALINNGTPDDTADDPNFIAKVKVNAAIDVIKYEAFWFHVDGGWVCDVGVE